MGYEARRQCIILLDYKDGESHAAVAIFTCPCLAYRNITINGLLLDHNIPLVQGLVNSNADFHSMSSKALLP